VDNWLTPLHGDELRSGAEMGKRQRKRRRGTGGGEAATSTYPYGEDNSLTLRDELSGGTLRTIEKLDAQPAASADDRWQRRVELLFERLVVRWEIAGLPLDGQKELLGRYRMASAEERRLVREVLAEHIRKRYPDLEV
jgi:hypothetical protein